MDLEMSAVYSFLISVYEITHVVHQCSCIEKTVLSDRYKMAILCKYASQNNRLYTAFLTFNTDRSNGITLMDG